MNMPDSKKRLSRRDLFGLAAAARAALELSAPAAARGARVEPPRQLDPRRVASPSAAARRRALRAFESKICSNAGRSADEERFPEGTLSFTKALPHGPDGRVDREAYRRLVKALRSGSRTDFERVPIGGYLKLGEPEAALELHLLGPDAAHLDLAPPPEFSSRAAADEMRELYWMALLRDEPFDSYATSELAAAACAELNVPRENLFRGPTPADLRGPYISQFLFHDVTMHPLRFDQKFQSPPPSVDHLVSWEDWLAVQSGQLSPAQTFEPEKRHIRNGRDLAEYVRRDFSYQAFLNAALILLRFGTPSDGAEPNKHSRTRSSFAGFGSPLILHLVAAVAQPALRICWYHKWLAYRRLRPEEFGGLVQRPLADLQADDLLLRSDALARCRNRFGSALLPAAYPEGCPVHPSYPAGHAVVAGACATVLKAYFDESFELPRPIDASPNGLTLRRLETTRLFAGGELDKLASNVSFGRNFAGIHYRTDSEQGMLLGERIAIEFLRELMFAAPESFPGWSLRTFSGARLSVGSPAI